MRTSRTLVLVALAIVVGLAGFVPTASAVIGGVERPDDGYATLCKPMSNLRVCVGIAESQCLAYLTAGVGGCWLRS